MSTFRPFIGPLVIWLIQKDKHPSIDAHGKEALNFQITVAICAAVAAVLVIVIIGFFLLAAVGVANLVFCIIAGVAANEGKPYRYPLTFRFIK